MVGLEVVAVIEVPAIRTTRTRYDEAVKELAYEVYSKRCNGDMPATIKLLAELVDPPLSEKTIYYWRDDLGWRQRFEEEKQAIAPYSWDLYFGGLAVAAPEVVSYFRSTVADESVPHRDRIAAGRALLNQVAQHMAELEKRMSSGDDPSLPSSLSDEELLALALQGRDADQE
jgi:hypothetical protein